MAQARKLTRLDVREVSLVDKAANKRRFAILKAEDGDGGTHMDEQVVLDEALEAALAEPIEGEAALLQKAGEPLTKASEKAKNAIKGALRMLNSVKDEVPAEALKALASAAGYGYPAPQKKRRHMDDEEYDEDGKKKPIKKADDVEPTIPDDLLPLIKDDPEVRPQIVTLLKAADEDPVAKAALELHRKQATRLRKAEEKAAGEEQRRLHVEALAKAKEFPYLPTAEGEIASALVVAEAVPTKITKSAGDEKDAKKTVTESFKDWFVGLLTKTNTAMKENALLKEAGSGTPAPGSALAQLTALAEGIVQKSADKALTKEQAFAMAANQNPGLYAQYQRERPAAH